MVTKILHLLIDMTFLAAIAAGAWVLHPSAGLIVGGVGGLLLHYAASVGSYDQEPSE